MIQMKSNSVTGEKRKKKQKMYAENADTNLEKFRHEGEGRNKI